MHRRAMWESGWTPSGPGGGRHGQHGRFGARWTPPAARPAAAEDRVDARHLAHPSPRDDRLDRAGVPDRDRVHDDLTIAGATGSSGRAQPPTRARNRWRGAPLLAVLREIGLLGLADTSPASTSKASASRTISLVRSTSSCASAYTCCAASDAWLAATEARSEASLARSTASARRPRPPAQTRPPPSQHPPIRPHPADSAADLAVWPTCSAVRQSASSSCAEGLVFFTSMVGHPLLGVAGHPNGRDEESSDAVAVRAHPGGATGKRAVIVRRRRSALAVGRCGPARPRMPRSRSRESGCADSRGSGTLVGIVRVANEPSAVLSGT